MGSRRAPPREAVEHVLRPLGRIARKIDADHVERDRLILAAAANDPRPTNRQIADELGWTEAAVRKKLPRRQPRRRASSGTRKERRA